MPLITPFAQKRTPDDDSSPWTPAARVELYREVQEQKEADEARRSEMEPKHRDAEKEHKERTQAIREEEERAKALLAAAGGVGGSAPKQPAAAGGGESVEGGGDKAASSSSSSGRDGGGKPSNLPRMANEGRIDFSLEDEDGKGNCVLRLPLPRFMDTSLVDLDVHPWYVSAVIKNKLFRIHWPEEVRADAGSAKRSASSGELVITVPKLFPRAAYMTLVQREKSQAKARKRAERSGEAEGTPQASDLGGVLGGASSSKAAKGGKKSAKKSTRGTGGGSVMDMIMSAAAAAKADKKKKKKKTSEATGASKAVSVAGIVAGGGGSQAAAAATPAAMTEKSTRRGAAPAGSEDVPGVSQDASMVQGDVKEATPPVLVDSAGGVLEMKETPPAPSGIEEID